MNYIDPSGLARKENDCNDSFWETSPCFPGGGGADFGYFGYFDFRTEMDLEETAYMLAHTTPEARNGLAEYDAFVAAASTVASTSFAYDAGGEPTAIEATSDCTE